MIANYVAANTLTHGSNEHESHFLFDMAYNNDSEVQPDILSTDTEGANQLNFLLLHLIGKQFAPRYRTLTKKMDGIISYATSDKFKDYLIKPQKQINEKLILSEEDNVKHILASLLLGEINQSHMVAKLSSSKVTNKTKRALWEMNAILMTDHLLTCVSDIKFRQAMQAALNRGEAYNQLRRHIAKVNGKDFLGNHELQIAVGNECARLLTNCVIYYNAVLLNGLMEKAKKKGDKKMCEIIKRLSPIAWTHIYFQGKFEISLSSEISPIDIEALLLLLESIDLY